MKVSIITVVYNNKDTIKDAIESVLSQTYKNIEYIKLFVIKFGEGVIR
ncbi:glycosyltransferase [Deferribacter abyssi]